MRRLRFQILETIRPLREAVLVALVAPLIVVVACRVRPTDREAVRAPTNVLLLSVDSVRADRLKLFTGDANAVETPALATLAQRGVLFTNAWAVTPWTAPSVVSMFTGLYPPSHGVVQRDDTTPASLPTLARLAQQRDYRLGNFTFFSRLSYFENLGLPGPVPGLAHGREPKLFADWLAQSPERPFFAWLHLLDAHLPYGATGYEAEDVEVRGSSGLERAQLMATVPVGSVRFRDGDAAVLRRLYDRDLVTLDGGIATVVGALEEQRVLGRTLIVLVADHGEELLDGWPGSSEHPSWVGHASTSGEAKLIPAILHVPMIIAGPGVARGVRSDEMVQQVDILPTVASLLGWRVPGALDGHVLPIASHPSWLERWRRRLRGGRDLVYFDSSVGGNLTPYERRGERLQGASDGRCLLSLHTVPGAPVGESSLDLTSATMTNCSQAEVERLRQAQARWMQGQLTQRLALLGGRSEGTPSLKGVEAFAEALEVAQPAARRLRWSDEGGLVRLAWRTAGGVRAGSEEPESQEIDPTDALWVQYRVGGGGALEVSGMFQAQGAGTSFGPFPAGFWNDLAGYSPFRFRVLDFEHHRRSAWTDFDVMPTEGG